MVLSLGPLYVEFEALSQGNWTNQPMKITFLSYLGLKTIEQQSMNLKDVTFSYFYNSYSHSGCFYLKTHPALVSHCTLIQFNT